MKEGRSFFHTGLNNFEICGERQPDGCRYLHQNPELGYPVHRTVDP